MHYIYIITVIKIKEKAKQEKAFDHTYLSLDNKNLSRKYNSDVIDDSENFEINKL